MGAALSLRLTELIHPGNVIPSNRDAIHMVLGVYGEEFLDVEPFLVIRLAH